MRWADPARHRFADGTCGWRGRAELIRKIPRHSFRDNDSRDCPFASESLGQRLYLLVVLTSIDPPMAMGSEKGYERIAMAFLDSFRLIASADRSDSLVSRRSRRLLH